MNLEEFNVHVLPLKNKLFRFAQKMVYDHSLAEDVVQESMIKIWKAKTPFEDIKNIEAWAMRITKNVALDKLKSKHRRTEDLENAYDLSTREANPEDQAQTSDLMEKIQKLLEQIPEKQKMVFHLRDIEGLSYKEIAEALDMPLTQVKTNLFRARQYLKEQLIKTDSYGIQKD